MQTSVLVGDFYSFNASPSIPTFPIEVGEKLSADTLYNENLGEFKRKVQQGSSPGTGTIGTMAVRTYSGASVGYATAFFHPNDKVRIVRYRVLTHPRELRGDGAQPFVLWLSVAYHKPGTPAIYFPHWYTLQPDECNEWVKADTFITGTGEPVAAGKSDATHMRLHVQVRQFANLITDKIPLGRPLSHFSLSLELEIAHTYTLYAFPP